MKISKKQPVFNSLSLPIDYVLHHKIDLKSDKKKTQIIFLIFVIIFLVMYDAVKLLNIAFNKTKGNVWIVIVTILFAFIYMILHELIHGLFIWIFSHQKPHFKIRLPFLTTGSPFYFNKLSFLWIALSPVIILGIGLALLMIELDATYLLSLFIVQVINIAGSAGDYYQMMVILRLPSPALIQDNGQETSIYTLR